MYDFQEKENRPTSWSIQRAYITAYHEDTTRSGPIVKDIYQFVPPKRCWAPMPETEASMSLVENISEHLRRCIGRYWPLENPTRGQFETKKNSPGECIFHRIQQAMASIQDNTTATNGFCAEQTFQ